VDPDRAYRLAGVISHLIGDSLIPVNCLFVAVRMPIPSNCPACEDGDLDVTNVPPQKHDQGDEWVTRATCPSCSYLEWFE
jgi:hypothetical protein